MTQLVPKNIVRFVEEFHLFTSHALLQYYGSSLFVLLLGVQWLWRRIKRRLLSPSPLYPPTPQEEIFDELHGKLVKDPYRWLENIYSYATVTWLQKQQKYTLSYFNRLPPDHFIDRYRSLLYLKYGASFCRNGSYYYLKETADKTRYVLYKSPSHDVPGVVFIDPVNIGSAVSIIHGIWFSRNHRYMAIGIRNINEYRFAVHIYDLRTGIELSDVLHNCLFHHVAWTHESAGFFYCCVSANTTSIYYHSLHTQQSDDRCVLRNDGAQEMYSLFVSDDGNALFIETRQQCSAGNCLYALRLVQYQLPSIINIVSLIDYYRHEFTYISCFGDIVLLKTTLNAPCGQIIAVDINASKREPTHFPTFLPERQGYVLQHVYHVWNRVLLLKYLHNGAHELLLLLPSEQSYHPPITSTSYRQVQLLLPPNGSLIGVYAESNSCNEFYYQYTSLAEPSIYYHAVITNHNGFFDVTTKIFRRISLPGMFPTDIIVSRVYYSSKDGTLVPMFIAHRTGLKRSSLHPTLLCVYGGFGICSTPVFSVSKYVFMKNYDGVVCLATVRGGGELGRLWHETAKQLYKQRSIDDIVSAAEYLISEKWTSSDQLALYGGSNGGLLVAASMNQRPDLFGAVVAQSGLYDMLRYTQHPTGSLWIDEYGDPADEGQFLSIIKYSPLHNIPTNAATYPAVLLTTGARDSVVLPLHSYKFIAALQHKIGKSEMAVHRPLLLLVDTQGSIGHERIRCRVAAKFSAYFKRKAKRVSGDGTAHAVVGVVEPWCLLSGDTTRSRYYLDV